MAKPQKPSTKAVEKSTAVMSRNLNRMVRTIADHRDETMLEVLDRVAGPAVLKEYKRVLDEMHGALTLGESGA